MPKFFLGVISHSLSSVIITTVVVNMAINNSKNDCIECVHYHINLLPHCKPYRNTSTKTLSLKVVSLAILCLTLWYVGIQIPLYLATFATFALVDSTQNRESCCRWNVQVASSVQKAHHSAQTSNNVSKENNIIVNAVSMYLSHSTTLHGLCAAINIRTITMNTLLFGAEARKKYNRRNTEKSIR